MKDQMTESFIEKYKLKHRHPLNRLSHFIGIPLIVFSLPSLLVNWRWALGFFVSGWLLQFAGHAIEGNRPAFFQHPVYLVVGPLWILRRIAELLKLRKVQGEKVQPD